MNYDNNEIGGCTGDPIIVEWKIHDTKKNCEAHNLLSWSFIVLPRFKKSSDDRYETSRDAWIRLFKCDDEEQVIVTEGFTAGNKIIRKAYHRLANLSSEQLSQIHDSKGAEDIINGYVEVAKEEGRQEGREEGREEMLAEIARAFGMDIQDLEHKKDPESNRS
jgi:predicted transposase/invertase (TIGR01784 family)